MRMVTHTTTAAEAHVAVAALENAGIDAVVQGEYMGALPTGLASHPSVWVRDEDYAAACELLGVGATTPTASQTASIKTLVWIAIALLVGIIGVRILSAQ